MSKTTVVFHNADYDGIFCREIARKFLPDAELIGWDFGNAPMTIPEGQIYVMDLPLDAPFGLQWHNQPINTRLFPGHIVWIDHHKSAIESHPSDIPGYRIDGVAACRLVWQWFEAWGRYLKQTNPDMRDANWFCKKYPFPQKQDFIDRRVSEPLAVRLAGEYDIWDKRDPDAETFQYGLRFVEQGADFWEALLLTDEVGAKAVTDLLGHGRIAQTYQRKQDANLVKYRSFRVKWEGLDFLCLNTGQFNSLTFAALDKPETGHDALMGFRWDGAQWTVSLYHAAHRTDIDLSLIAVKHGGGGHRGACGFRSPKLDFIP